MDEDGDEDHMMQATKVAKEHVVVMDLIEGGYFPLSKSVENWVITIRSVTNLLECKGTCSICLHNSLTIQMTM